MIRVAVIGAGYWGAKHIRVVRETPEVELCAVCDCDEVRLELVSKLDPGTLVTGSLDAALSSRCDAVAVCTPATDHFRHAVAALEMGKHVLVEKPLCLSYSEARHLAQTAARKGLVVSSGLTFVYHPAVVELKRRIETGFVGRVLHMRAERLNLGIFRHDVDVTWDLAPHDISIMAFLLGRTVRRVNAVAYSHIARGKTDVATIHLEFSGGATAEIALSWLDPHKVRRITVIGDEKMAVFDDMSETEKLRFYDKSAVLEAPEEDFSGFQVAYRYGDVTIPNVSWSEPLREEWADFAAAISESRDPRSGLELGLEVVSVLEACQASMRAGSVWMGKDGLADDMVGANTLGQGTRPLALGTEVSYLVRRPPL